jgi:hypothetical protein
MPRSGAAEKAVYRREVRLGPLRHWWRRFPPLCLLFAVFIGVWSLVEMQAPLVLVALLGETAVEENEAFFRGLLQISQGASEIINRIFLFIYLMLGPTALAMSLKRDLQGKVVDSVIVAGASPKEYLRAKLIGAVRPTHVVLVALWVRWLLFQLRYDHDLSMSGEQGELSLIVLRLSYGSISFMIGAAIWLLGVLCYAAMAMTLTLRWKGMGRAVESTALVALVVDVLVPVSLTIWGRAAGAGLQDWLIGAMVAFALLAVFLKLLFYIYLKDLAAERFSEWTQE